MLKKKKKEILMGGHHEIPSKTVKLNLVLYSVSCVRENSEKVSTEPRINEII